MSKEAADLKEYELGGALRSNSSKIEKSAKMLKTSQKWHVFLRFFVLYQNVVQFERKRPMHAQYLNCPACFDTHTTYESG